MLTYTITQARKNLFALADAVLTRNQETIITTKKGDLAVIDAAAWKALQETVYLSGNSQYKKTLLEGLAAKSEACLSEQELDW